MEDARLVKDHEFIIAYHTFLAGGCRQGLKEQKVQGIQCRVSMNHLLHVSACVGVSCSIRCLREVSYGCCHHAHVLCAFMLLPQMRETPTTHALCANEVCQSQKTQVVSAYGSPMLRLSTDSAS